MVIDYSKFAKLADELEVEEEMEKVQQRIQHRINYQKRQDEKVEKWRRKKRAEGKSEEEIEELRLKLYEQAMHSGCGHSHGGLGHSHGGGHGHGKASSQHAKASHGHGHGHGAPQPHHDSGHGHSHGGKPCSHSASDAEYGHSETEPQEVPNNAGYMGCGFATPEQIKEAEKMAKKRPPLAERNKKKREAALAAREDGNHHFREGKYEIAVMIYDRALTIIADMYGNDDADEMELLEGKVSLNMAACNLKMKQWNKALDNCELARQAFGENAKKNPKIPYRITEAYIGLQKYKKASESLELFKLIAGEKTPSYVTMKAKLDKLMKEEDEATRKSEKAFAKRFKKKVSSKGDYLSEHEI